MKKMISFLLSAYLVSTVSPAFAQTYSAENPPSYGPAIDYVTGRGMMSPTSDGRFHPEQPLTRVDLIRSIVRDVYSQDVREECFDEIAPRIPARYTRLFTDLSLDDSAAREVCVGMFVGIVEGRPNGSFGANFSTNLVETAKIVSKAYGIAPWPALQLQPTVPWHEPYWYALAKRGAIPETVENRSVSLTRGEYAEILYRLRNDRPAMGFRYGTVHVKDAVDTATSEASSTAFRHPMTVAPDLALLTNSVPVVKETAKLSSGLAIQMHVEERRLSRLTSLESKAT